jgi:inhibitor of KinA
MEIFPPIIKPLGDSAIVLVFGSEMDLPTNRRIHALDRLLNLDAPHWLVETIPTYTTLLIRYDPLLVDFEQVQAWALAGTAHNDGDHETDFRTVEIPTVYGGTFGPDLENVAQAHAVTPQEIIRLHTGSECVVYMMGFTPGFPYMGGMDPAIATPRLATPRTHVPAGSVGIAGMQTGIYPIESPGGWQIIGWTPLKLFDLQRSQPFLLAPGDRVRFVSVTEAEAHHVH